MLYEVLKEMHHLGRRYLPGEPVALKPFDVHQLVLKGYVREVPPPVPAEPKTVAPLEVRPGPATKQCQPAAPRGRLSIGD